MQTLSTPVVMIHVIGAVLALIVGAAVFLRRKGTVTHVWFGRTWALLMLVVAVSSFWITGKDGLYSWIHGLSVFIVLAVPFGVYLAIRGNVSAHRKLMSALYVGALLVAGLFSLHPDRMLGELLWTALGFMRA
jgi:uncharacterized membrane protein